MSQPEFHKVYVGLSQFAYLHELGNGPDNVVAVFTSLGRRRDTALNMRELGEVAQRNREIMGNKPSGLQLPTPILDQLAHECRLVASAARYINRSFHIPMAPAFTGPSASPEILTQDAIDSGRIAIRRIQYSHG